MRIRCEWAGTASAMVAYHDDDWGVPTRDDHRLFELLTLEGAQAGLSWSTILNKRAGYRAAFADFDPARVARFTPGRVDRLVEDASIVRHRAKIESTVNNAGVVARLQREFGSFASFLAHHLSEEPAQPGYRRMAEVPASTVESTALSKELKRRGFGFVGPTTVYAFMQAAGYVNDHTRDCFRWSELGGRV